MTEVLHDANGVGSISDPTKGWARSPYGMRLGEDPNKAFKNLLEMQKYITASDAKDNSVSENVDAMYSMLESVNQSDDGFENSSGIDAGVGSTGKTIYTAPNYTDTRVGGNDAINPYWQFNRDDDIIPPMLWVGGNESGSSGRGMGRVYAEMYDDNQQILWMRMGVPEFVNVAMFYMGAGNASAASAMNSGGLLGLVGSLIRLTFKVAIWALTFPIIAPFWIVRWISRMVNDEQITKYYYFKPAMGLYYEMVNTMLSYTAVGMGLYPQYWMERRDSTKVLSGADGIDLADSDSINSLKEAYYNKAVVDGKLAADGKATEWREHAAPELKKQLGTKNGAYVTESGIPELLKDGPDIFVMLNRRARLFNAHSAKKTTRELLDIARKEVDAGDEEAAKVFNATKRVNDKITQKGEDVSIDKEGQPSAFWSSLKGTVFGANDFIGFRVERSVDCTESISNQTGPTGVAQKINAISAQKRDEFEDAGGSTMARWLVKAGQLTANNGAGWSNYLTEAASAIVGKLASAIGIGDIGAIITNGNGFLDIPEVWKNSSFSKSYSFTVQLRARYGDPCSIFQSVYIPLFMLLAAALPRAIGDNMYTSPFVVNAYCKGMFSVPCGIIDSMTIRRGKDEFGWNNIKLPTAVDISFSIRDLSPTLFLAMQDIGIFDTFKRNTNMMEYLDTLSAIGLSERLFFFPKLMRKLTAACLIKKNTIFSGTYWGASFGRSSVARLITAIGSYGNYEQSDLDYNAKHRTTVFGLRDVVFD